MQGMHEERKGCNAQKANTSLNELFFRAKPRFSQS